MASDRATEAAIEISSSSEELLTARLATKLSPKMAKEATRRYLQEEVQPILDATTPFHITHNVLRRIERKGLSVRRGLSFRANMMEMSEARKLDVLRPAWVLDAKNSAYSLLDEIGARRPKSDRRAYTWSEIKPEFPSVIKATKSTGARGCYLLFNESKIVHVKDHKILKSLDELNMHAAGLMDPSQGRVLPDDWMVEELVLEDSRKGTAARNLKFYCFYGETIFIQESRREPDLEVCFYTPDNEPVRTGRYEDLVYEGVGVTQEHVKEVARISKQIPHPFMRIDMLNGEDGLVFGEFTPRPGNFDELNAYWDRRLGEEWARAESRILADLLSGKKFDAYLNSTNLLNRKRGHENPGSAGG